ncbi:MAG: response regulator transcription factor [Aureispira sp.]|nr:response regulator transcription factor [Aureispira sp.]
MKKIRSIIIEDEPKPKAMLKALLSKYCPEIELVGTASNVQEGVSIIKKLLPELIFLDIEMPGEKGINLFQYFEDIDFEVIFTTAYDKYAINALKLSALDYLLKPINLKELRLAIAQFEKKQKQNQRYKLLEQQFSFSASKKRLVLPSKDNFTFLNMDDIMYCLLESSYTTFVTKESKKYLIAKPIKEYTDLLENFGFLRVHRSAIVNPSYIKKMTRTRPSSIIMNDGTTISVARNRRNFLIEELTKL